MSLVPKKELYRRTIESLESSYASNPENTKFLQQLALAYFKSGYFNARALELYERAAEEFPADVKLQRAVSISMSLDQARTLINDVSSFGDIDLDGLQRMIDQLNKIQEHYPDSPEVMASIADVYLIRGDYRDSLHFYRSALALGYEDIEGTCKHFQKVHLLYDLPPDIISFFAELYQRNHEFEKASDLYVSLMAETDLDEKTLNAYHQFLTRQMDLITDDSDQFLFVIKQLCEVSLLQNKASEAIRWAKEIPIEQIKEAPDLVKKLSRVLISMEDFRQAFDYLSKIKMDQEAKGYLNEIAVLLEQRGEIDTAAYVLQYINENDQYAALRKPKNSEAKSEADNFKSQQDWEIEINTELQLAELHWKSRRWEKAFESYIRVLEMGYEDYRSIVEPMDSLLDRIPDVNENHLAFLANFFAERRDWHRTLFYSERALFLNPALDDIRARLVQACEQLLLQNPNASDVRIKLGDLALEKGNIEKAMKCYRKAATVPEFGMKANRRMAVALFRAGDLKTSFHKFQELPVLENEDLENLYDLMISFQNSEQWKMAIEAGSLIRDFDSDFRDTVTKIGFYEEKLSLTEGEVAIDPKMRELIGDHSIGRYRYIDKIGSGGMGVVHKVLDLKTNTEVAMKILREGLSGSDKAIDRFFREARIAATLQHQNIVNILDYNISNFYGQSYIAMEFVDGPSLRDVVEDKFESTIEVDINYIFDVMLWMMQTCDALNATHRKGIIHRDIKPDNIMLAPNNLIKLTDFGIVHIEEATFTPTGALIGTPRYMSPEQVHGGRIDARSDIYSVGIIMYEILIGTPPFISGDISYQQVNVIPANPKEICSTIPDEVDAIVMKCLEKKPSDRYESSLDLKQALEEAFIQLGGDPVMLKNISSPSSVDYRSVHKRVENTGAENSTKGFDPTSAGTEADDTVDSELDLDSQIDDHFDRQDKMVRNNRPTAENVTSVDTSFQTVEIPPAKSLPPTLETMPEAPHIPQRQSQMTPLPVSQQAAKFDEIDKKNNSENDSIDEVSFSEVDLEDQHTSTKQQLSLAQQVRAIESTSEIKKDVADIFDWEMDLGSKGSTHEHASVSSDIQDSVLELSKAKEIRRASGEQISKNNPNEDTDFDDPDDLDSLDSPDSLDLSDDLD